MAEGVESKLFCRSWSVFENVLNVSNIGSYGIFEDISLTNFNVFEQFSQYTLNLLLHTTLAQIQVKNVEQWNVKYTAIVPKISPDEFLEHKYWNKWSMKRIVSFEIKMLISVRSMPLCNKYLRKSHWSLRDTNLIIFTQSWLMSVLKV